MKKFNLSCVQIASGPNVEANLLEISKYILKAKKLGADLIILPENFSMMAKKDSMYLDIKEDIGDGRIQDYISNEAKKNNIWIVAGTIPIKSPKKDKVFSTCIVFNNKGIEVASYNKVHLFDVNIVETKEKYKESDIYLNGNSITVFETPFCKSSLIFSQPLKPPSSLLLFEIAHFKFA